MQSLKLLLLEDDVVIANEIKDFFHSRNVKCDTVFDGISFFKQLKENNYDQYLLDINVPLMNGVEVCKKLRESDRNTPVIMLTAYGEIDDKVGAFQSGADDYLVKPFHLEELYVRSLALNKRKNPQPEIVQQITVEDLIINLDHKTVERAGVPIVLTPKEYKLLVILAEANGRTLSKHVIAQKLWNYHIETSQNTIEVYINFLRNKIDKNAAKRLIHTKIGFGYYLKVEA